MAIPSRQIGQSAESSLLWQISKQLEYLTKVTGSLDNVSDLLLQSIDSKTPELDANKQPVIPSMTNGGNLSITTNVTGSIFTSFTSQVCKQLNVSNQTGVTIEVQQNATGVAFQIPAGAFYTFFGITNTNQLAIRRVDLSNTPVIVTSRWEV